MIYKIELAFAGEFIIIFKLLVKEATASSSKDIILILLRGTIPLFIYYQPLK